MDRIARYLLPPLARLLLSGLFIWGGYEKLAAPRATAAYFAETGIPVPTLMVWVTIVIELVGGLVFLLGFRTRVAALVLAFWTLLTGFAVHFAAATTLTDPMAAYDNMIHFYKNLAIAGGLLYVAAYGAGALSIDNGFGRGAEAARLS